MNAVSTPVGLVFRRVLGPDERERARRLVETVGATVPSADGVGLTWYGLHDLAALGAEDLVGVAVKGGRGPGRRSWSWWPYHRASDDAVSVGGSSARWPTS